MTAPGRCRTHRARSTASPATARARRSTGSRVTGMAYASTWTSTDQIPERAVASGLIGRFGSLDPTDGGDSLPLLAVGPLEPIGRRPA